MAGIVIFLLIRVKMLLYFLYGTYRNGNSYKFTPFLRIYAFGNVFNYNSQNLSGNPCTRLSISQRMMVILQFKTKKTGHRM